MVVSGRTPCALARFFVGRCISFLLFVWALQTGGIAWATAPTITSFSPPSGAVGVPVTINGTNFNATPSKDTVKFNGTTATVSSATTTRLVATVPSGATTGTITVTVSN